MLTIFAHLDSPLTIIGYNVSYSTQDINSAATLCNMWVDSTASVDSSLLSTSCPCTLLQARVDERFHVDTTTDISIPQYNSSPSYNDQSICYTSLIYANGPSQR